MATKRPKVKCYYGDKCIEKNIMIDRDVDEFIQIKNRYAHYSCYDKYYTKEQQEKTEYRRLTDLIKNLYAPTKPD